MLPRPPFPTGKPAAAFAVRDVPLCFASLLFILGKEREHNFQPGDNVEVCEGELINLQGKILSVDGNKITILPKHEDLKVGASALLWPSRASGCTKPLPLR